ncbi:MAG: carboxypeptidase family protein [Alphaproteobacteria bacterium]|nr:carboxypeptidase family protein [Alphaproteobacteria bacterium]
MRISSQFDSGSITLKDIDEAAGIVSLRLRPDQVSDPMVDIRQWFHFRLQGAHGREVSLRIAACGDSTFPGGWKDYQACASYDRRHWFRVPTGFDGDTLAITHTPERDSIFYAYFEPYSWEQHLALLGRAGDSPRARVIDLGSTLDGRDMNLVRISDDGAGTAKKQCWIIARQHPGETMAEWLAEGLIERLLDKNDVVANRLLAQAQFHIVPNMNPDGSVRGNLRVNAAGANLNREWVSPSPERSPEVHAVRAELQRTGCDFFLDVHGDEVIPYVFAAGCEMLPSVSDAQRAEQQRYVNALAAASPEFQTEHGYPASKYSEDALKLASKWVGHTFGCVSLTLELPFKDNANRPDTVRGWSAARSKQFGRDTLDSLAAFLGA